MGQQLCPQCDTSYDCKILDACPNPHCQLPREISFQDQLARAVADWAGSFGVESFSARAHGEALRSLEGVGR